MSLEYQNPAPSPTPVTGALARGVRNGVTIPYAVLASLLLYLLLAVIEFKLPDVEGQWVANKVVILAVYLAVIIAALAHTVLALAGKVGRERLRGFSDIALVTGTFMLIWTMTTAKLGLLNYHYWPSPAKVLHILQVEWGDFVLGSAASMSRLIRGFILGLVAAVPLGVVIGWYKRLFNILYPIIKFVAPIPPIIYIPYALVVLPTIDSASVFVIAVGVFWPVLTNTVYGVAHVDKRLIEAAYTLGASERTVLTRVVVPAARPTIFAGVLIGLILGFIMLTVAETIGAATGIGYFLIYYKDVADYPRVVADIVALGAWTFIWTYVFDRVQHWSLRWQRGVVR